MESLTHLSITWVVASCLALSFVSAILPWVNAELLVLSLPAVAGSPAELGGLVLIVTTGQMAGKCIVYWTARRAGAVPAGRLTPMLDRWRERARSRPSSPIAFVAFSSIAGVPPFYFMSMVAGALKMNFGSFLVAGTSGRLIRFAALAFLPQVLLRAVQI